MHREALTQEGLKVLSRLSPVDFLLGGGTGLALQLGHRLSEDLDFFSEKEIAPALLGGLEKNLTGPELRPKAVVNNKDELTVFAGETKITFLYYPFPVMLPAVLVGNVAVFSVREIAAMKAYALGRRGTLKDYVDLYFVLHSGEALQSIAELAERKYEDAFDTRLFLEQLVYVEDIEDLPVRFLGEGVKKEDLRRFFEGQIRNFPL